MILTMLLALALLLSLLLLILTVKWTREALSMEREITRLETELKSIRPSGAPNEPAHHVARDPDGPTSGDTPH